MDRSYVICHALISLDGKIQDTFQPTSENMSALREYAAIREFWSCPATIYDTITVGKNFADGLASDLAVASFVLPRKDYIAPVDAQNYIVAMDPYGTLAWHSNFVEKKNHPRAHIIEVLTNRVPGDYLAYLHSLGISYVFAGAKQVDCKVLLQKLKAQFGIERLMLLGDGLINWSFAQEERIDELSLVLSPVADANRAAPPLFEKANISLGKIPPTFSLTSVEQREGSVLWLRYLFGRGV